MLCVVRGSNGATLRIFDETRTVPDNIKFEHTEEHSNFTSYYFRSDSETFCVFGREAARIFYPTIDKVVPIFELEQPGLLSKKVPVIIREETITVKTGKQPIIQMITPDTRDSLISSSRARNHKIAIREYPNRESITHRIADPTKSDLSLLPIIIIDEGVRLSFANYNYNVEITTFYYE